MHSLINRFILDKNKQIFVIICYFLLQVQSEASEVLDLADVLETLVDFTLLMRICPKLKKIYKYKENNKLIY